MRKRSDRAEDHNDIRQIMGRNIEALLHSRREFDKAKRWSARAADAITGFTGSMASVLVHAAFLGGWLVVNTGLIDGLPPFDPFPFVMLAMIASVEAIFLTTFVLISQNRMQVLADRRADLDVQISLLTEHELTQLITLVDALAKKAGVIPPMPIEHLKSDVHPRDVLQEIEKAEQRSNNEQ